MPQTELLQQARSCCRAMVDAVEALVSLESPTEDVAACEAIVAGGHRDLLRLAALARSRRVRTTARPVWRWGPDRPRILLLGHLDTVWPVGSLARLPFANDGERMRGPGVFDMKAGVVQGWAALALAGVTEDSGVGMLLTTDEETGSLTSRGLISAAIEAAEAVLVLEPSADGALKTARKGTSWYSLEIGGRAAHAGLDPERGVNALVAAAELTIASTRWSDGSPARPSRRPMLTAGTTSNTVPAQARLTLDVRAWSADEQLRVDRAVRAWRPSRGRRHRRCLRRDRSTRPRGVLVLGAVRDRPGLRVRTRAAADTGASGRRGERRKPHRSGGCPDPGRARRGRRRCARRPRVGERSGDGRAGGPGRRTARPACWRGRTPVDLAGWRANSAPKRPPTSRSTGVSPRRRWSLAHPGFA